MSLAFFDSEKRNIRKSVYVDGSSVSHEIKEVWYVDGNGVRHQIWPCRARLTNVYIVELRDATPQGDRVSVAYTNSQGNNPNITLLPGHHYTVKGDVELLDESNSVVLDTLQNCYFFGETIASLGQPVHVHGVSGTTYGYRPAIRQSNHSEINSTWGSYAVWNCDTDIGSDPGYSIQAGYYVPEDDIGYIQLNYLFDPNYSTPVILKRATINQTIVFAKNANSSSSVDFYGSPETITDNSSLTIYPKYHKTATADGWGNISDLTYWESYEAASNLTLTYNQSDFTVVSNQDGSFTVTPRFSDPGYHTITFSNGTETESFNVVKVSYSSYSFYADGGAITGNGVNINGSKGLSFYDSNTQQYYNGNNYTITSSDPSIISVNDKTLLVNLNANLSNNNTVLISGTVEGNTVQNQFSATATGKQIWYKIDVVTAGGSSEVTSGNSTAWNPNNANPYTYTWNGYSNTWLKISFARDSAFTIPLTTYLSASTSPFYASGPYITLSSPQSGDSINVPVYLDSSMQQSIGSITITLGTQ